MKAIRLLVVLAIVLAGSVLVLGQSQPNLENGFKPYGSYEGSSLDSVNVMNGNVMLHAPFLSYPQRGKLTFANTLYLSSKAWQVQCKPGSNGNELCWWNNGGSGVAFQRSMGVTVHRTVIISSYLGTTTYDAIGYTVTSVDGQTHQLNPLPGSLDANGDPNKFESLDNTGWHLEATAPDANHVASAFTIIDRQGNQYLGGFGAYRGCNRPVLGMMLPSVGGRSPMVDDAPYGDKYCSQFGWGYQVTDSNGNQMTFAVPGHGTPGVDTLGRSQALEGSPNGDTTGCVSVGNLPISSTDTGFLPYLGQGGATQQAKLCYATVQLQTAFNQPGVMEIQNASNLSGMVGPPTLPLVVTVIEADGSTWLYDYDSYGNVTFIGLPTGGSIRYTWTTIALPFCGDPTTLSRAVSTRTLTDNNGNSQIWQYTWGTPANGSITNAVRDPLGNDTVHVFTALDGTLGCGFYETSTRYYQGPQASNNLLKQVDTTYSSQLLASSAGQSGSNLGNVVPTSIQTTVYPSGKVSKVTKQYDTGLGANAPIFGNVVVEKDYDWGQGAPGPLLRETDTTYQWQVNYAYLTAQLIDLPASVIIRDGSGCALAETDYTYDETAYLTAANISTQHAAPPYGVRGNLTSVTRWLAPASSCNPKGGTAVTSHTNWYDTGEAYQQIDPLGHTTAHSYDPAYVGAYSTQTCSPSTNSVAHCVSGTYDFSTGLLTSFTNENATAQASGNTSGDSAHTSNFSYDVMWRLTSAQAPPDPANSNARATNNFSYATSSFPWAVTRTKSVTTTLTDSATSFFDGLGRGYRSQHTLPNGIATVDTTFDAVGHVATVSNPYFSTSDATYGLTQSVYDALDRATQVTKQDSSISTVAYDQSATVTANSPCTLATDEAGQQRRTCSDALGRLIEIDEPNPGAVPTNAGGTVTISGAEQTGNSQPATAGHGSVTISGGEQSADVTFDPCQDLEPPSSCPQTHTVWDGGTVSITVNGHTDSVNYGQSMNTDAGTLASALAGAINGDAGAFVTATLSGTTINLVAKTTGGVTNYSLSSSAATGDPTDFGAGSFAATASGATLTGGQNASSTPDTGSVTVTVNGTGYTTGYAASDNSASIAGRLAASISAGSWANASASGGVITLTSKITGPGGNYSISAGSTWNTGQFTNPSFTTSPSDNALTGGYNASDFNNNSFVTLYQYDALGNLLRVDQKGSAPNDSTKWRTRTFTHNSLSQLITATNPESGTITYTYDADGNLVQKTSPAANQTGSTTQTISYCYDALHRVTGKAYSAQICTNGQLPSGTAAVSYAYDSGTNARGKLTSLTDAAGSASYTYDVLGRMATETRVIAGVSKAMSYEYNLDGSLKVLHYPSGAAVTYTPDSAGRILSAVDAGNNINYATGATYGPDSGLTGFVSGNSGTFSGITNTFVFDKRLQPCRMAASSTGATPTNCDNSWGNVLDLRYDFHLGSGDNGNVYGIINYRDQSRNQTFTYDPLNRLTSAQNAGADCSQTVLQGKTKFWGNAYAYDAWGNLLQKTVTKCSAENLSVTALGNNQLSGYSYDAAGNMTSDPTDGVTVVYDQENRIASATKNGVTTNYIYDSDGSRVEKTNGGSSASTTLYWYMSPGIVAESDLTGTLKSEYVFFAGERVARKDFPSLAVSYYFSDHLKTTDIVTDAQGNIKNESDFYPWGGELQFLANDSNHYKFTGKERDAETGLDYFGARYYSNGLGRWISADWSATPVPVPYADFQDPQTLNLYSYVRDVPTTTVDLDGHSGPLDVARVLFRVVWELEKNRTHDNLEAIKRYMATHTPPSYAPPGLPHPQYPPGTPCWCNPSGGTANNSKENNNNSNSSNTAEQGRDAQGRFLPKKGGEAAPGSTAEKQGLDSVGAVKNTEKLNGTIRDGTIPETEQHVEVKSGASVSNTEQLRSMGQTAVDATGKPLKVVTTNPNVKVSQPALDNKNLEFEHKPQK